ncbi:MAG: hypothetical protein IT435_18210 [Phycisphaerales bacterium]|nr:hypothetical protein [Phycisphaerales bacterium]
MPGSQQITLTFPEAPPRLWDCIRAALAAQPVVVVGITGPVGSGKSTLARALLAGAGGSAALLIPTDNYLPDYHCVPEEQRDDPTRADLARLEQDLAVLKTGSAASCPVWSFHTHRREGEASLGPAQVVICEGIHALQVQPRRHIDIAIFVEAPRQVRWSRWEAIELAGDRGMGVERARDHFNRVAEPTFAQWQSEYRRNAHFIVLNGQ